MSTSGRCEREIGVASVPVHSAQYSICLKVLNGLLEILTDFGYVRNDRTSKQVHKVALHWSAMADEFLVEGWMKVAKYKTAAFFASHAHRIMDAQEPVPPPGKNAAWLSDDPSCLFGGHIWKWLKNFLDRSPNHILKSFLSTIMLAKKGLIRPDDEVVALGVESTFKKLTRPVTGNPLDLMGTWQPIRLRAQSLTAPTNIDYQVDAVSVLDQIRRTVRESFSSKVFSNEELYRPFVPSTNANYNMSRNKGGALGELYAHEGLLGWLEETAAGLATDDYFHELFQRWNDGVKFTRVKASTSEDEDRFQHEASESPSTHNEVYAVDTSRLDHRFKHAMIQMRLLADKELAFAQPVGLSEALKVRVITKGPPLTYTVLKPLQKWCWRVLKDLPVFGLIGKPVDELYVHEQIGKNQRSDGTVKKVLSVDYSDASNEINPLVTRMVWDALCDFCEVTEDLRRLGHKSLIEHVIVKDKQSLTPDQLRGILELVELIRKCDDVHELENLLSSGDPSTWGFQTWGQLMGGILSFIALCLANATILRWTSEVDRGRTVSLRDMKGAVNGDDGILSAETDDCYGIWSKIAGAFGMKPSWGKVQFASQYLNINSMPFEYVPEGFEVFGTLRGFSKPSNIRCYWRKIKFVNYGIMNGMTRSASEATVVQRNKQSRTFGSLARELMLNCPESLRPRVLWRFISNNWEALSGAGVPWFMPEWMGGVGLPPLYTVSGEVDRTEVHPVEYVSNPGASNEKSFRLFPTEQDLLIGKRILRQWHLVQPKSVPLTATWQMHEIAMGLLPSKPSTYPELSDKAYAVYEQRYSEVYGRLCVQAAFSSRLEDIFVQNDDSKRSLAVLKFNRKLWSPKYQAPGTKAPYYPRKPLPNTWVLDNRPSRKPIVLFELGRGFKEQPWEQIETLYPAGWQEPPPLAVWGDYESALDNVPGALPSAYMTESSWTHK